MTTAPAAVQEAPTDPRAPRRVRHETRRRSLTVKSVEKLSPHLIRVSLGGDLQGFTSLGFDDHIKLFFPDGPTPAEGEQPMMARDYTPRRYNVETDSLEIEFALHDAGPATQWAEQAAPGQTLQIGGPRGSFVVPLEYDWHLFIGDDTALPAIARRLGELPAGARAVIIAEIDGPEDRIDLPSKADVTVTWAYRDGAQPGESDTLSRALKSAKFPAGDYYAWVACESLIAKALRAQLLADHKANPKWMRAAGYWRRGAVAVHDTHND